MSRSRGSEAGHQSPSSFPGQEFDTADPKQPLPLQSLQEAFGHVRTMEDSYTHRGICCGNCEQAILGARFRCDHCQHFDLCSSCHGLQSERRRDPDHDSFYKIQYHHLDFSPGNGDDLAMLQHFDAGETSESFYLHFPWFISPDVFNSLVSGTHDEAESRNMFRQMETVSAGSPLLMDLDSTIRLQAPSHWNWRAAQDRARPLLELQLSRAQSCQLIRGLYLDLETPAWDTTLPRDSDSETGDAFLHLRADLFAENLDPHARQHLRDAAASFLQSETALAPNGILPSAPRSRISGSAIYMEQLSKGFDLNSPRVPTFEELEILFNQPRTAAPVADPEVAFSGPGRVTKGMRWSLSQSLKAWDQYIEAYQDSIAKLDETISDLTTELNDWAWSSPAPLFDTSDTIPSIISSLIVQKDFSVASTALESMSSSDPLHLFYAMRFHEARGDISAALDTAESAGRLSPEPGGQAFGIALSFATAKAYFNCLSRGDWVTALGVATSALKPGRQVDEPILIQAATQLYGFKIVLQAVRDRNQKLSEGLASKLALHLSELRRGLMAQEGGWWWDLALDALELELQVVRVELAVYELAQSESRQHQTVMMASIEHAAQIVVGALSAASAKADGSSPHHIASTCRAFGDAARILFARTLSEHGNVSPDYRQLIQDVSSTAEEMSAICRAEFALFRLFHGLGNVGPSGGGGGLGWNEIESCFQEERFFKGLLMVRELRGAFDLSQSRGGWKPSSYLSTSPALYGDMLPVALQSGNRLQARLFQIRSMGTWTDAPTFLKLCENCFHLERGFLSDQVFIEASSLLARIYDANRNYAEAAAYAFLHLRLAHARHDALTLDTATMLHFRCVGKAVRVMPEAERPYEVVSLLMTFFALVQRFCRSVLRQLDDPKSSIFAGTVPIEALLWPADLLRHTLEDDYRQELPLVVIIAVHRLLKLAVDLSTLLPNKYHGLFHPSLCHAVGVTAETLGSAELSVSCYDLGLSRSLGLDGFTEAMIQLRLGHRLGSLARNNGHNFRAFRHLSFDYLGCAEVFFWGDGSRQSSYELAVESSMLLAKGHLEVVQEDFDILDFGQGQQEEKLLSPEQKRNRSWLLHHVERGLLSARTAVRRNFELRRKLSQLSAMQALVNSRLLYFGTMEELYWNNMGLGMDKGRLTGDFTALFWAVQTWKAVSFVDVLASRVQDAIEAQSLQIFDAPALTSSAMLPNPANTLDNSGDLVGFDEETLWSMMEAPEVNAGSDTDVIFVDWARYYDTLFMIAVNGTQGDREVSVIEFDYHRIEKWVRDHVGISSTREGRPERRRLGRASYLKELMPLIEPLEGIAKPGDLLVFCPTGILHAVPLQAIPFGPQGKPLIVSNPVVFSSSLSLMHQCTSAASKAVVLPTVPTLAVTRFGQHDQVEEERMRKTAMESLVHEALGVTLLSGREATVDAFKAHSHAVRLLHYHGHAYLEAAERKDRGLHLESIAQPVRGGQPDDTSILRVMDILDLHLDASVVILLACASGEDDIGPNDDPLGLLSAFLYAGACSVVATRWPTQTSDARDFAMRFYRHAFTSRDGHLVNLARAVQAAVVELIEEWDEDEPYHWAQFQLHGSWFAKI